MGNSTHIEWTDSTWNPIRGCTPVSAGCKNCYAAKIAKRFSGPGQPYEGLVRINAAGARTDDWSGDVHFVEKHLLDPLKWGLVVDHRGPGPLEYGCENPRKCDCPQRPRRIFVNSMSDLFHPGVPDEWIDKIFAVMALCPQHTFQILTKRPERMLAYLDSAEAWNRISYAASSMKTCRDYTFTSGGRGDLFIDNVQLGVSVENQETADERIPLLMQTPAAVRFISAEPLLGAIDLQKIAIPRGQTMIPVGTAAKASWINAVKGYSDNGEWRMLDWVIVGGESGPGARPMHPDWARGLRDQCVPAGVPFFFKQWGEFTSEQCPGVEVVLSTLQPGQCVTSGIRGHHTLYTRVGKKAAGSLLDGREWKEFPCPR
jgi:protein gp37